ncbi:class I SAM-dependent DNA methyltransferase [Desulfuribacillus alkaliarsenatis]|uniref:Methyltransferase type 12 domain-containing protein n=1 Tax=Desulfuribacillus alkaliarsenatis TaxID=766136 RepID=A0A1E5G5C2_9FIRM|nr:class I SAM-dependent methyltransferase [Desulfuribacillus alkaliarsenatis]OEF98368.1 hypothetical protein BHF68_01440 [Desulfuribacillus alkaliarsenatis]
MSNRKIWDQWAKRYERLWVQKFSLQPTRQQILRQLREYLQPDIDYKILDVGCGIGQLLREIRQEFPDYNLHLTGIDYSQQMIEVAKQHNNTHNGDLYKDIDLYLLDVEQLGQLAGTYDVIVCTHSFPYYSKQLQVLQQFHNKLNNQGYLFLAQASENTLYDRFVMSFVKLTTGKANYLSIEEIKSMSESLFKCEKIVRISDKKYMPSLILFAFKKTLLDI